MGKATRSKKRIGLSNDMVKHRTQYVQLKDVAPARLPQKQEKNTNNDVKSQLETAEDQKSLLTLNYTTTSKWKSANHTRQRATRQSDSNQVRRSGMQSHAAATGALLASPMTALCCRVHQSTIYCRQEQCLYSLHHPCDLGTAC